MDRLFGTDGIRGKSNIFPMDAETAMKVGMAAGAYFTKGEHKHSVIIGKDTRLSGYMIEAALVSGFTSMGMNVFQVGPLPTPAVAMITRSMRADVGVMISASHNKFSDNGIKLFQPNGLKLDDSIENKIEKLINSDLSKKKVKPEKIGRAKRIDDAPGRYIEFVKQSFPKRKNLNGLKIVLDCANGASYKIAPIVFYELGAEVITMGTSPNGFNINDGCGSTFPESLRKIVLQERADIGIAFDGDADRLIVVDEKGKIVNGDQIIAAISGYWNQKKSLKKNTIVTTVMSNMGMEKYLNSIGIKMERTKVGDRYVTERMREGGYNLGGEQSGHIIFNDYTTTGDGIIAAIQVLAVLVNTGEKASKALNVFKPWPQVLKSVDIDKSKPCVLEKEETKNLIKSCEHVLNGNGRLLIRRSGTEPIIRVMTESVNKKQAEEVAESLRSKLQEVANI